jgi:hypothetical protein
MSAAAPAVEAAGLRLVVRCHAWLLALGAASVDRVAGDADLPEPRRPRLVDTTGALGLLDANDEERYAAWDLGRLLGLGDVQGAWVLLRLPFEGRTVAVALRTGPCVGVNSFRPAATRPLPKAAFLPRRRDAIRGAFALEELATRVQAEGALGLELRPERLLTREELALSASWLEAQEEARA